MSFVLYITQQRLGWKGNCSLSIYTQSSAAFFLSLVSAVSITGKIKYLFDTLARQNFLLLTSRLYS